MPEGPARCLEPYDPRGGLQPVPRPPTLACMGHVAWLGTGLLGSGFVEGMLGRGERVVVWNRSLEKARALEPHGAQVAADPAQAVAGAERVHLCLSDDHAVDEVLAALRPALGPGVPIFDHTTVSPTGARARQLRLAAEGVPFLGCPVFMGPPNARAASGTMLCAGASADVERWAPSLRGMTGELLLLGEDASRPATLKLVGNGLLISVAGALADVFALAVNHDVSPAEVMELVSRFPLGSIIAGRGARMASGDHRASFELTMARKDVSLMIDAAGTQALGVLPGLRARMDALISEGHGRSDLGVLSVDAVPSSERAG